MSVLNSPDDNDVSEIGVKRVDPNYAIAPFRTSLGLRIRSLLGNSAAKRLMELKTEALRLQRGLIQTVTDAQELSRSRGKLDSDRKLARKGTLDAAVLIDLINAYCGRNINEYKKISHIVDKDEENADILASYELCRLVESGEIAIDENDHWLLENLELVRNSKVFRRMEKREFDSALKETSDPHEQIKRLQEIKASNRASDLISELQAKIEKGEIDDIVESCSEPHEQITHLRKYKTSQRAKGIVAELELKVERDKIDADLEEITDPVQKMSYLTQYGSDCKHASTRMDEARRDFIRDNANNFESNTDVKAVNQKEFSTENGGKMTIGVLVFNEEAINNGKFMLVDMKNGKEIGNLSLSGTQLDPEYMRDLLGTSESSPMLPGRVLSQLQKLTKSTILELTDVMEERRAYYNYGIMNCTANPGEALPIYRDDGCCGRRRTDYLVRLTLRKHNGSEESLQKSNAGFMDAHQKLKESFKAGHGMQMQLVIEADLDGTNICEGLSPLSLCM